ncbi:hypothetical protein BSL82_15620 [Tardibacter chloracetimidivorans]|uniref:Uncharacterized protein n=1 Tax=Tardibacter chloracetimidivorans TaxID=1921510 RepID=A0A1L3ZY20_9SPHN|nr:hypothetical protein [Tardibacter chloracetimidivorans]API60533.1 hypothetical protein BSL82_15620 [Tardibacter chloracetimidivorans]
MARGVTLGEMVTSVRIEANMDPDPALSVNMEPLIKELIRREYERLYEEFDWPFLRIRSDIDLQAGQRYYDVPDDLNLERIERIDYFWGDKWFPLDRGISMDDYNFHDSDADVRAEPAMKWDVLYTGSEAQLEIWPIPATNDQKIRIIGIRNFTPLITTDAICDLDDRMIILFAASEILARKQSPEAATKQTKAVERFRTVKGRSVQTRKSSFSFSGGNGAERRRDREPLVAYVRNP